jgi:hypothetical protein
VGGSHITPPRGDVCLGVEAQGEADLATGACSLRRCWWRQQNRAGWAAVGRCVPAVGLVQYVGRLNPVGRHGDGIAAHKEFHRLLSPREDLVGAALRGLQSPAKCVLAEEDVRATVEVLVHEHFWGGVARCWNWSQAGHVSAELRDEVRWFHLVGRWSQ